MYVEIPKRNDRKDCYEIFVDSGSEDDLWWSVVLSFLMPYVEGDQVQFEKRLETICDAAEMTVVSEVQMLKKVVGWYNPFRNRYACYYQQELKDLVARLRNRMNMTEPEILPLYCQAPELDSLLQRISLEIKCPILIEIETKAGTPVIETKRYEPTVNNNSMVDPILLHCKNDLNIRQYHFFLPNAVCEKLQERCFSKLLGNVFKIPKIKQLYSLPNARSNFFLALFKNKEFHIVRQLLKAPHHILVRLSEAGFDTDPTKRESERSTKTAFYYALHEDLKLFYMLYDFATRRSRWLGISPRNANNHQHEYLEAVKVALSDTAQLLDGSMKRQVDSVNELIYFHDFVSEMSDDICRIVKEDIDVVKRSKKIITSLLDKYMNNFEEGFCLGADLNQLVRFRKYFIFFHNLDIHAGLIFFDHLYTLKNSLRLEPNRYEKMESSFARLIFVCSRLWDYTMPSSAKRNYLRSTSVDSPSSPTTTNNPFSNFAQLRRFSILCLTAHIEKMRFLECVQTFHRYLSDFEVSEENISKMSESERYTLKSEPVIKDEIVVKRLDHYLTLVEQLKLEDGKENIKVIQRSLLVLGESLKLAREEPITLIKSFLASTFPKDIDQDLKKIRNRLVHYEKKQIAPREEIENDLEAFLKVREELININSHISFIYAFQELVVKIYIYKTAILSLKKCNHSDARNALDESVSKMWTDAVSENYMDVDGVAEWEKDKTEPKEKTKLNRNNKQIMRKQLQECFRLFNKDLKRLRVELQTDLGKHISQIENHLQNHFSWLENWSQTQICSQTLKIVESRFRCIKILLAFLVDNAGYGKPGKRILLEGVNNTDLTLRRDRCDADEINLLLSKCRTLKDEVYTELDININLYTEKKTTYEGSGIHQLKEILFGRPPLQETIKEEMISKIPPEFKRHHEAKMGLIEKLKSGPISPDDPLIKDLILKHEKVKKIRKCCESGNVCQVEQMMDYYGKFVECLAKNEMNKNDYDLMCKKFKLSDSHKAELLKKIVKGQNSPDYISSKFFEECKRKIRDLLITPNYHINHLWKFAKGVKTKDYIHDLVVRQYIKQNDTQAKVEMLYLHAISASRDKILPQKENRLFTGASLKGIIAHGNPLFELIGDYLDITDLPNEMIFKALKLIQDIKSKDQEESEQSAENS